MRFLSTAVLSGMMSSRTANGLNLINAPVLAEEAGLKVVQTHTGNTESQAYVAVRVGSAGVDHVVTGELIIICKYNIFLLL